MAEFAYSALAKALRARIAGSGGELWGQRVYPEQAPSGAAMPYAIYSLNAGGDTNLRKRDDAEYMVMVKIVSTNMNEAMTGAGRISALLNNAGIQDNATTGMTAGSDWSILTTDVDQSIQYIENVDNVSQFYHAGHMIRIQMEANS